MTLQDHGASLPMQEVIPEVVACFPERAATGSHPNWWGLPGPVPPFHRLMFTVSMNHDKEQEGPVHLKKTIA